MTGGHATVIVPTVAGGARLTRMLESLGDPSEGVQVLVVDNGSADPGVRTLGAQVAGVEVIRLERTVGYTRAVNLAAAKASGDALVLLNDDCVCDPGYVEAIVAPLDPVAGVTMAAGVMRESRDRSRIDTAGVELDRTLLAFDYLNGEPVTCLDHGVPDPVGPSGAAAAYDRDAFLAVGGFDENLFAYLEDVDLVLRMRTRGGRCVLVPEARGTHEHSATLGSGSGRKNYLMGFGRGYMLRKWSVLSAGRVPSVLIRELAICAGQAVVDRNLAGVSGRVHGLRSSPAREPYPSEVLSGPIPTLATSMARRWHRRARLRVVS